MAAAKPGGVDTPDPATFRLVTIGPPGAALAGNRLSLVGAVRHHEAHSLTTQSPDAPAPAAAAHAWPPPHPRFRPRASHCSITQSTPKEPS